MFKEGEQKDMGINLKACDVDPNEYVDITEHNLKEIDTIDKNVIINNLVKTLADV